MYNTLLYVFTKPIPRGKLKTRMKFSINLNDLDQKTINFIYTEATEQGVSESEALDIIVWNYSLIRAGYGSVYGGETPQGTS